MNAFLFKLFLYIMNRPNTTATISNKIMFSSTGNGGAGGPGPRRVGDGGPKAKALRLKSKVKIVFKTFFEITLIF
jgi:hypothetical protein